MEDIEKEEKPVEENIDGDQEGQDEGGDEAGKSQRTAESIEAENRRKTQEISALREEINRKTAGYNPNDLTTWDDNQLRTLMRQDGVAQQFKDQADDIITNRRIERKVQELRDKDRREQMDAKRIAEFPETADPVHPMAIRARAIAQELGLSNDPGGRYAAAKMAAMEMKRPKVSASRLAKDEAERKKGIQSGRSSADVPGKSSSSAPSYDETLKRASRGDNDAFFAALKAKGGGSFKGVLK